MAGWKDVWGLTWDLKLLLLVENGLVHVHELVNLLLHLRLVSTLLLLLLRRRTLVVGVSLLHCWVLKASRALERIAKVCLIWTCEAVWALISTWMSSLHHHSRHSCQLGNTAAIKHSKIVLTVVVHGRILHIIAWIKWLILRNRRHMHRVIILHGALSVQKIIGILLLIDAIWNTTHSLHL